MKPCTRCRGQMYFDETEQQFCCIQCGHRPPPDNFTPLRKREKAPNPARQWPRGTPGRPRKDEV